MRGSTESRFDTSDNSRGFGSFLRRNGFKESPGL